MSERPAYVGPTILLTLTQVALSWAVFASPVLAKQALPELGLSPEWIGLQPTLIFSAALTTSMLVSPLTASVNSMRLSQILLLVAAAPIRGLASTAPCSQRSLSHCCSQRSAHRRGC